MTTLNRQAYAWQQATHDKVWLETLKQTLLVLPDVLKAIPNFFEQPIGDQMSALEDHMFEQLLESDFLPPITVNNLMNAYDAEVLCFNKTEPSFEDWLKARVDPSEFEYTNDWGDNDVEVFDHVAFLWHSFDRYEMMSALLEHGYGSGEELFDALTGDKEFTDKEAHEFERLLHKATKE